MEYRLLGKSGFTIPVMMLGTATFNYGTSGFTDWGTTHDADASRMIDICLDAGVNMFDSADIYSDGQAETILGKAIAGKQNRVLISTKGAFRSGEGPNDVGTSRRHLRCAVEGSLKRLGIETIDLYQLHGFDAKTPVEETMKTLEDLVKAGKIRYIGCSNHSGWQAMKCLAVAERYGWERFIAHQAHYSLLAREYEWELMPLALAEGMGTVVWSPLAQGRLTGKIYRNHPAPEGSRVGQNGGDSRIADAMPQEQFYQIVDVLKDVAAEAGRSVPQVALNWLLQRPAVTSLIIGARNEQQLRENLGAVDFKLTADQMRRLDQASSRPPNYPYWHQLDIYEERNPFPVSLE